MVFAILLGMAVRKPINLERVMNKARADLLDAGSMYKSLLRLNGHLEPCGVRDIVYVHMLHARSHIRNDYMFLSSFSDDLGALFREDGGGASYNFGDLLPRLSEPLYWDIKASQRPDHPLFSYNRANKLIYEQGYRDAWLMPMDVNLVSGYGFMMVFLENRQDVPQPDIEQMAKIGPFFHKLMKLNGLMAQHFLLTDKQRAVLEGMAEGKTAADLAQTLGIAQRSVELRLRTARQKLKARTTTEAVYKALAYAILPYHPGA